jgi:hypothetical protein
MKSRLIVTVAMTVLLAIPVGAAADQIRIWTARAIATVLADVGAEFERAHRTPADRHQRPAAGIPAALRCGRDRRPADQWRLAIALATEPKNWFGAERKFTKLIQSAAAEQQNCTASPAWSLPSEGHSCYSLPQQQPHSHTETRPRAGIGLWPTFPVTSTMCLSATLT